MKTSLYTVGLFALALAVFAAPAVAQHAHDHGSQADESLIENPDAVVHVKGLACQMCARSLTKELKKLDAIDRVQVILEDDQHALITLKEKKKVIESDLRSAVANAGFTTREVVFADSKETDGGSR